MSKIIERQLGFTSPVFSHHLSKDQIIQDQVLWGFVSGASDAKSLTSMTSASYAYQAARILTSRWMPGVFSAAFALTAEVACFRSSEALLHKQNLESAFEKRAFLATSLNFFLLKSSGKAFENQHGMLSHAAASFAMVAGQDLGAALKWVEKDKGAFSERWMKAELCNLQMRAGASLMYTWAPQLNGFGRDSDMFFQISKSRTRDKTKFNTGQMSLITMSMSRDNESRFWKLVQGIMGSGVPSTATQSPLIKNLDRKIPWPLFGISGEGLVFLGSGEQQGVKAPSNFILIRSDQVSHEHLALLKREGRFYLFDYNLGDENPYASWIQEDGVWNELSPDEEYYFRPGQYFAIGKKRDRGNALLYKMSEDAERLILVEDPLRPQSSSEKKWPFPFSGELKSFQALSTFDWPRDDSGKIIPISSELLMLEPPASMDWRRKELFLGEMVIGTDKGPKKGYKEYNEDRFLALQFPDGRSTMWVIDGMGGHPHPEWAAELIRAALDVALRSGLSMDEGIEVANRILGVENQKKYRSYKNKPSAVLAGVQVTPLKNNKFRGDFRGVADCEALVLRFTPDSEQPPHVLYWSTQANFRNDFYLIHRAPHNVNGVLDRAHFLPQRFSSEAHLVASMLDGGNIRKIDKLTFEMEKGDVLIIGTDGLFDNFGTQEEIALVLHRSGARTALEIKEVLMKEVLLRMTLLQSKLESPESDYLELTRDVYRSAYREIFKKDPPAHWKGMYESDEASRVAGRLENRYVLFKDGIVAKLEDVNFWSELTENESGVPLGITRFKIDNITLGVQVLGKAVDEIK